MKKLISAAIFILFAYSCRKDAVVQTGSGVYLHSVLTHLRDSLSVGEFMQLDTGGAILTDPGEGALYTLRFPFTGKSLAEDFLLLRTDSAGAILKGQVVHLENTAPNGPEFFGNIRLRSLSGGLILNSGISNGFISALHGAGRRPIQVDGGHPKTGTVLPAPDADWLPEVVVVGYSGGASPSPEPYIALDGLLGVSSGGSQGDAGNGGGARGGGAAGGSGGGSGGGAAGGTAVGTTAGSAAAGTPYSPLNRGAAPRHSGLGVAVSEPIGVEKEYIYSIPTVDIRKYFNCFDLIPSGGASYTIQLCVDLPVNSNPDASMNFSGGVNAGHTFLAITKSGSGINVTQCFGYYPQSAPSAWNPFSPITSAIKDNGNKEINASISMSINSDQFNAIRSAAINLSVQPYFLDKSNCTDYALNVFNAGRITPLAMEPYILRQAGIVLSNGMSSPPITVIINNSPQKLYDKLAAMKASGGPEASSIQLDLSHNLQSPISHGACN